MGSSSNWFGRIRRKFVRSSNREIIVICSNTSPSSHEERADYEVLTREDALSTTSSFRTRERCLTKEDIAAIKIQAFFRGQLVHNINPTHLFSMQTSLFMRKVLQCLHKIWKPPLVCDDLKQLTGKTSISSTQEPGEAASTGSRSVCEETSTCSYAMHACTCPVASQGSCPAAPQRV